MTPKVSIEAKYGVLIDMNKREKKKNKKIWEFEMEAKSKMDILLGCRDWYEELLDAIASLFHSRENLEISAISLDYRTCPFWQRHGNLIVARSFPTGHSCLLLLWMYICRKMYFSLYGCWPFKWFWGGKGGHRGLW